MIKRVFLYHMIPFEQIFQLTASRGGRPGRAQAAARVDGTFNSRPHKEADQRLQVGLVHLVQLSTHGLTRRPTRSWQAAAYWPSPFNSRPHEEADVSASVTGYSESLSTRGLTRRTTGDLAQRTGGDRLSTRGLTRRPTKWES